MNVGRYTRRNRLHRWANRLRHPWPIYRRVGGISAVVHRADGTTEDLGDIADTFGKRWVVQQGGPSKAEEKKRRDDIRASWEADYVSGAQDISLPPERHLYRSDREHERTIARLKQERIERENASA